MFDQDRFGHYRTDATRAGEPHQRDKQMNQKDDKVAHFQIVTKRGQNDEFWPYLAIRHPQVPKHPWRPFPLSRDKKCSKLRSNQSRFQHVSFSGRTGSYVPLLLGGFMQYSCVVLILSLVFCASAFPQDSAVIQCDADMKQVPAWTAPGSAYLVEQLSCGQTVSIIELERGYFKIQFGNRVGYVFAKYVRLTESQEQPMPRLEESAKQPTQRTPQLFETEKTRKSQTGKGWPRRHHVSLNYEISHIKYREPDVHSPDGLVMKESGIMQGVSGDFAFFPKKLMLKIDGRFSFGKVDYSSFVSGSFPNLRDYQAETRFSFGYVYSASERIQLTPFAGVGYRFIFNGLAEAGPGGYDRRDHYLYSPLGIESVIHLRAGWSLLATGEYDLFWRGWQHSYDPGTPGLFFDQSKGWGARASAGVIKNLGPMDFSVGPYFRYWDIGDSNLVNGYHEPPNTSKEWGGKVGIRF